MAIVDHTAEGVHGGSLRLELPHDSTGAEITLTDPDGCAVTVFTGNPSLLWLASKCAALSRGMAGGDPLVQDLYGGHIDHGVEPYGAIILTPDGNQVTVSLRSVRRGVSHAWVRLDLDLAAIGEFGHIAAAAAHDL